MYSLGLHPVFVSATLIDNIFTSCMTDNCTNGLIVDEISDQLPIFPQCSKTNLPNGKQISNFAHKRRFSDMTLDSSCQELENSDWNVVINCYS